MSSVHTPQEKKQLAYKKDHYNRGGQSDKEWRKIKPRKKARARRAFRKASKEVLRASGGEQDLPQNVSRKEGSIRQRRVTDLGAIHLREFVATRRLRNMLNTGAKKARRKELEGRLRLP